MQRSITDTTAFPVRYAVTDIQCRWGFIEPSADGIPRICPRDRFDHGPEPAGDGHDAASVAEHRRDIPRHDCQPAAGGAFGIPDRLRNRPVHHGTAFRPLRPAAGAGRRHGALLHRQRACDYGVVLRDLAAGARIAGAWHLRHPRDCDLDRSRLLCGAPHGQRNVAGDDDLHRRARDRAVDSVRR